MENLPWIFGLIFICVLISILYRIWKHRKEILNVKLSQKEKDNLKKELADGAKQAIKHIFLFK
jgi:hypothetical protein